MPTSTPTPEAIVSIPLEIAALGLLAIAVGAAVAILAPVWLWRRRAAAAAPQDAPHEALDVPWLASLLEQFDRGALVVDWRAQPVAWNEAAARTFVLDRSAPELPLALLTLVARALSVDAEETTEIVDEQERRLRITVSPLGDATRIGALILVRHAGEQTGNVEAYRRLIGAMAHELRTPLTAILGHADILGSCDPQRDQALWRRSCGFIASEAERLARLVEDLLILSRLDLTPLRRRPVNLRAVAEEAISSLFQAAEARGMCLSLQSAPGLPRVPGDRDRLHQVFLNLLDNAIKYTPPGGQVVVHLSAGGDGVQVAVRDSGAGIAPDDLEHIFEPLYRGQDVRDAPGTGLGLTIVRTILEQHGSTIHVESAVHQGTTFRFCLPYAD